MSNYDHIFDNQSARQDKTFNKEEWAEKKQAERKAIYELADTTAGEVTNDGGRFKEYLDVQAKFDRYSVTNTLLIFAQMPQATWLKDFDGWRDSGETIKKQQKGISILEPGDEYVREDGSRGTSYHVKKVFDVSQTTTRIKSKNTETIEEKRLLGALIHNPPVPLEMVETLPDHQGALYDHEKKVILVQRGMSAEEIFRSVSREIAHGELACRKESYVREETAFIADAISYLLCRKYGIDPSCYDFLDLPEQFRDKDTQQARAVLTEIRDTAGEILTRMYRVMEQGKKTRSGEQER